MPSTYKIDENGILPQTKDDLKQQIFRLTSALSVERSRNKELHRQKLSELRQAKNELEKQKESSSLILKALNDKEVLLVHPENQNLADSSEFESLKSRNCASERTAHEARDKRASSSLGVYSSNSPYIKAINTLQREVHLLRESKKELEQRLQRAESQPSWFETEADRNFSSDQSGVLSSHSFGGSDWSVPSPVCGLSSHDTSSPSRQTLAKQFSSGSRSTFVIEEDFNADEEEEPEKSWNESFSPVGGRQVGANEVCLNFSDVII